MLTPALYYPYIHFRDVNWLKASLLCFQQVRRIVPPEFALNDPDEVSELHGQIGADQEPLIKEEPAYNVAVWQAQERLLLQLRKQPQEFLNQFTAEKTRVQYPPDGEKFQMHRGKMYPLVDFLRSQNLAWPVSPMVQAHPDDYLAVHPKLGEAIMSTIAIAIAKEKGLGIVTSSGGIHRALADQNEDLVFQQLTGLAPATPGPAWTQPATDEFAMTILTTAFDVSKLRAQQVAELVREGKDLSAFKKRLDDELRGARLIPNPEERKNRLEAAARDIVNDWQKHRKILPKYALEALIPLQETKLSLATGIIAGATSITVLSAGVGLAIGLAAYAGVNAWQRYQDSQNHPLNYLSKIHQQGAALISHV
jgi:hypothetical protein